jgi:hypothetical protein
VGYVKVKPSLWIFVCTNMHENMAVKLHTFYIYSIYTSARVWPLIHWQIWSRSHCVRLCKTVRRWGGNAPVRELKLGCPSHKLTDSCNGVICQGHATPQLPQFRRYKRWNKWGESAEICGSRWIQKEPSVIGQQAKATVRRVQGAARRELHVARQPPRKSEDSSTPRRKPKITCRL